MEDAFLNVVPRALTYLYKEGRTGHWVDARTTSYVALALVATGETLQCPHLVAATQYLGSSSRTETEGCSWGSEVWDTALAIRALTRLPLVGEEVLDRAFRWIWAKQLPDGSFDGEPWDTLYVGLAAIEGGQLDRVLPTFEWLLATQSESGAFISSHYTGLFCQLVAKILEQRALPSSLHQRIHDAAMKALGYLWGQYSPTELWGGSNWTNAFIISGMVALRHPQILSRYDDIVGWYSNRQASSGAWDDIVRTAIVVEALWDLKLSYELDRCYRKQLQTLTMEFFSRSTQEELTKAINLRTNKASVIAARKFIDKDENGNRLITLTPERQTYLSIAAGGTSALWALITNWDRIRHLFRQ